MIKNFNAIIMPAIFYHMVLPWKINSGWNSWYCKEMKDIGHLGEKDEKYGSLGEKAPGVFLFPQLAFQSDTFPRYRNSFQNSIWIFLHFFLLDRGDGHNTNRYLGALWKDFNCIECLKQRVAFLCWKTGSFLLSNYGRKPASFGKNSFLVCRPDKNIRCKRPSE